MSTKKAPSLVHSQLWYVRVLTFAEIVRDVGFKLSPELNDGMYGHDAGLALLISILALPLQGESCATSEASTRGRGQQTVCS